MQTVIVVLAQVDGFDRFAAAVEDVKFWVMMTYPVDAHIWILIDTTWSFEEALHLRQAIELSAGARDDVGRHLLRVRSGAEDQEGSEVCMHFCCLGKQKRSAPLEAVEVGTTGLLSPQLRR